MSMTNNEDKEQLFRNDLHQFLLSVDMIDERLPEAPDLEELWQPIAQSYMPDAIREFNGEYPRVAFGWIMYVGMALAKYWDVEWSTYSKVTDLYAYLRDPSTSTTWTTISARRCCASMLKSTKW